MELTIFNKNTEQVMTLFLDNLSSITNIIADQFEIPPIKQIIKFNEVQIDTSYEFDYYNIKEHDMLTIEEGINENYYDMAQASMITNSLLYISLKTNGYTCKAMIDTGAQTNVISSVMVKTLKMEHLLDKTIQGVAKGVGSANIIGNLYNVPIKINNIMMKTNFKVMDTNDKTNNDLILLGLEFILTHSDSINFRKRIITIQEQNISFLNEKEIKDLEYPINEKEERIKKIKRNFYDCMGNLQLEKSLNLIEKIIKNIINNPTNEKFKSININSETVKQNILPYLGIVKLLEELGFVFEDKEIIYKKNLQHLEDTAKLLY